MKYRKILILLASVVLISCVSSCKPKPVDNEEALPLPTYSDEGVSEETTEKKIVEHTEKGTVSSSSNAKKNNTPTNSNTPKTDTNTQIDYKAGSLPEDKQNQNPQNDQNNTENKQDNNTDKESNKPSNKETKVDKKEPVDYSTYIKIASYNVMRLNNGKDTNAIIKEIRKVHPDIIGLQEVDQNRAGSGDQIKSLANSLGYFYYYFSQSIDYGDGAKYGTGILSKYPITKSETVYYKTQAEGIEKRQYSRSEININGKTLVFYNTHLGFGNAEHPKATSEQFAQLIAAMEKEEYAVCTGDFNEKASSFSIYIDTDKVIPLNGGKSLYNCVNTFPCGTESKSPIDNIYVTAKLDYYWNDKTNCGVDVNIANCSDHNMIYSYVQFK